MTCVTQILSYLMIILSYLILEYSCAHTPNPQMMPVEELLLHLMNLVAVASFLFLATSRDAALLYLTQFNHVPIEMETGPNEETAQMEHRTTRLADQAVGSKEQNWASEHRDAIAHAMWVEYQCRHRGRGAHHA